MLDTDGHLADAVKREEERQQDMAEDREDVVMDESNWPAHLRSDAPRRTCTVCERVTVAVERFGGTCGMTQPDGTRCPGTLGHPDA